MKRKILFLTVILFGVVSWFVACPADAEQGKHPSEDEMGWRHEGKGPKDDLFEKDLKEIGISDEQKEKVQKERARHQEKVGELSKLLKAQRLELSAELDKKDSDRVKITSVSDEMKKLMSQMVDARIDTVLKMKEILSGEQYMKLMELRDKRMAGKHEKRRKGEGKGHEGGPGKGGPPEPEFE